MSKRLKNWGVFGIHIDFLKDVQGGFYLRKKPLKRVLSGYTNSENAIAQDADSRLVEVALA